MSDLRAMSDDELEALKERGEEATEILDERERAAYREERARTPLTLGDLIMRSYCIETRTDPYGRANLWYGNVLLSEVAAACPIPPDMMATPENARTMAFRWDEYTYNKHLTEGDAAEPVSNAMLRQWDIYRYTREHGA